MPRRSTFPTCCNPKCKKDLDEGTDDNNFPDPPEVEDHVPTHVCNWAQAIVCDFPQLAPLKCQHTDCNFLFITSVELHGSKGKDIQIPLHVTAAFTTHSTNTNM
jgi:hypothetical protein